MYYTFVQRVLIWYIGHSRTIIGLEQSQTDNNKMFLLLLDPLKEKRDIMKIKTTTSCGNALHRYMRRSVQQETHQQYELVFINGVISDSKEREVSICVLCIHSYIMSASIPYSGKVWGRESLSNSLVMSVWRRKIW